MALLPALAILGQIAAGLPSGQIPRAAPFNVLLVTGDAKVIESVAKGSADLSGFEAVISSVGARRFIVAEWPGRGVVALDRRVGPLAEIQKSIAATAGLLSASQKGGVTTLESLSPDSLAALMDVVHSTGAGHLPALELKSGSIGVQRSLMATFRGLDGRTVMLLVPMQGQNDARVKESLAASPIEARTPLGSELAANAAEAQARALARGSLPIHLIGPSYATIAQGLPLISELLAEATKDLQQRLDSSLKEIGDKLSTEGQTLADGASAFRDLSAGFQEALSARMGSDWRAYGFANRAEAEAYLRNSGEVSIRTVISALWCQSPPNQAQGVPGRYMAVGIGTYPGGKFP